MEAGQSKCFARVLLTGEARAWAIDALSGVNMDGRPHPTRLPEAKPKAASKKRAKEEPADEEEGAATAEKPPPKKKKPKATPKSKQAASEVVLEEEGEV